MRNIEIYDTTLRDGAQMRDISFSVNDKLKILEILDDLGITYVEGGWPGANPKDIDFFVEAAKLKLTTTKLTAFGSTRKANTKVNEDPILKALLRAETQIICIVAKSSAWQIDTTMQASLEQNLAMLNESIEYLRSEGREVFVDAEHFFDGYKTNPAYCKQFIETAAKAGASRMILCDTNGGSLPEDVYRITQEMVEAFAGASGIDFGIHAHNDSELAVANSIRAIRAGAIQVQGTINGYGERCGNANLLSIIPNLELKYSDDNLICLPKGNLNKLTKVAKQISEIANMNLNQSQPFVGDRAFTHKGGLHASAIAKDKTSYEHIDPASVGNFTRVVVSEQSGVSNILDWFNNNGFDFNSDNEAKETAQAVLTKLKELEHQGYSYENAAASFDLLVRQVLNETKPQSLPDFFSTIESNVRIVNGEQTEATVRVKIGDKEFHSASLGNGPANAMDQALRKSLRDFYPEIDNFHLLDFKVRILDSHLGTAAITKVQVTTGCAHVQDRPKKLADGASQVDSWDTIGVSPNIVKASWDAIVDSIIYGLIRERAKVKESQT
ncbi:MAG: citramalate synthase [Cyanobacteria bacterium]|nr:citramalate synthase [Cyanobacteriota bacterium]MDA1020618.1 citramalate synthase [Cyanobacteriota bacterium]